MGKKAAKAVDYNAGRIHPGLELPVLQTPGFLPGL